MPLPQLIDGDGDNEYACAVSMRWGIEVMLVRRIIWMAFELEFGISIISGLRTPAQQAELRAEGRPAADDDRSTHLSCPATGADLRTTIAATDAVKARFGAEAVRAGLRWGGGSPIDPRTGIPSDWQHVDMGPRT